MADNNVTVNPAKNEKDSAATQDIPPAPVAQAAALPLPPPAPTSALNAKPTLPPTLQEQADAGCSETMESGEEDSEYEETDGEESSGEETEYETESGSGEEEEEDDEEETSSDEDYSDDDDEGTEGYRPGGYHPVSLGEVYNNKYLVLKKLGWGHFSTVWMVRDSTNGAHVALKVQKSADHYTEAAYDEIELLKAVQNGASIM